MKLNNIKSYVYYGYFQEAHFVAIDNLPPIIPKLFAITEEDGILVTLPYNELYQKDFKDISFRQKDLFSASRFDDRIEVQDSEGVSRKVRFLNYRI